MKEQFQKNKKYIMIFAVAILFRFFIYLISYLILLFQNQSNSLPLLNDFLYNWRKWDALHYINIATNGYSGAVENGQHLFLVFFPLYPYLMRILHVVVSDMRLAGMLISIIAYAGGCVYLFCLVKEDYGEEAGYNSVILLSLFPFAFFFGAVMTEGLFFFVSAATLYYIRKHKWWVAVIFGGLASMTRIQGILLVIPAFLELCAVYKPVTLWRQRKENPEVGPQIKTFIQRLCSFGFMFTGTLIYLLINWKVEGDPLKFMVYQREHWHQQLQLPTKTVAYLFDYAFTNDYNIQTRISLWMPQAVLVILCVLAFLYGIRRLRAMHMGYYLAYVLLTFSASWLMSSGRYMACCIPLFVILGIASRGKRWLMTIFTVVFAMLQVLYLFGYFLNMQIM